MIIQVFQSGGLAGQQAIPLGQLDTDTLTPAEQSRVRKLTEMIEDPPEGTMPIGTDLVEYRFELRADHEKQRTVVVSDDMDPDNPLLQSVHELIEIIGSHS